ncbi:MAG: CGNR zinc finger domain-containing protein [Ktedonobacteraceae bacterium]|nr:CGNR zinc finger domain-containing protein [Ktedonobacteraceae bacterium]
MQPGGRAPAPGTLALVQAFANTKDLLTAQDVFTSAEMLRAWLITRQVLARDAVISEEDFLRARAFREALRSLIRADAEPSLTADSLAILNQATQKAHLFVCFSADRTARLQPVVEGLDGALGYLSMSVFTAMIEGSWPRLKSCRNEECQWIYYDTSKNRSGAWCTMAMCGNRLKAHAYRQRFKGQQGDEEAPPSGSSRRQHPQRSTFQRQQSSR